MKIGVLHIIKDHYCTLKTVDNDNFSPIDFITFLGVPIFFGFASTFLDVKTGKDFYNLSITFFGIFIALLLNIQVAIFSVFQRNWAKIGDEILDNIQEEKIAERKLLLSQLNTNISYLIVVSCIYLTTYIIMFVFDINECVSKIISFVCYTHFMLTLMMIIKRTHALFQSEYDIG